MILNGKKIIVSKHTIVKNIFLQAVGLMFHQKINDYALVFSFPSERFIPITNIFVFQTIDLLWLDKNIKVVDIRKDFKPFTLNAVNKHKAKYVVELPEGTVKKKRVKKGDILSIG